MLGLIQTLTKEYIINYEQESGRGRIDALVTPRNTNNAEAIILEYTIGEDATTLPATAKQGIEQILQRLHHKSLPGRPYTASALHELSLPW